MDDGDTRFCDLRDPTASTRIHGYSFSTLTFAPGVPLLALGGPDGLVGVFQMERKEMVALTRLAGGVTALEWHPDLPVLICGDRMGFVTILHLESPSPQADFTPARFNCQLTARPAQPAPTNTASTDRGTDIPSSPIWPERYRLTGCCMPLTGMASYDQFRRSQ